MRVKGKGKKVKGRMPFLKKILPSFYLLPFTLFLVCNAHASQSQLKQANRYFWKGDYERALRAYDDALVDAPSSSILHFNAGDAAYQMGQFTRAESEYDQATQSTLKPLTAAAYYNKGNAYFREQKWADAIDAYKQSLRLNPVDADAKYNLGLAMRIQKNPSQAPKQPKSGQGKSEQSSASPKPNQPKPGQMSKEDAERLLSAIAAGEPKKPAQKVPKGGVPHPDEDW